MELDTTASVSGQDENRDPAHHRRMSVLLGVDAILLRIPDLDAGLRFYRDGLGHDLIWRTGSMAGLRMASSGTELVLTVDRGPEADLLVDSVDDAVRSFIDHGGSLIAGPHDIRWAGWSWSGTRSATSWSWST